MIRLAVFATHPIQYQAPLWRSLSARGRLDVTVHYFSDVGLAARTDPGFSLNISWDTPLMEGYRHRFLSQVPFVRPGLSLRLPRADRVIRDGHFDAVLLPGYAHAFEWQVLLTARKLGIPVVMRGEFSDRGRMHRGLRSVIRDAVLRNLYKRVTAFACIGTDARLHLKRLGVQERQLFFSPYSVDSSHFRHLATAVDRAASRETLGLEASDFLVLFTGKLIERKGVDILIAALKQIRRTQPHVVMGLVGDGPMRPVVEQAAREIGQRRLRLFGFVNQSSLGGYYAAADAFVLPSRHETWGLVVNEALYFGLPVIVSNRVGCAPDLVSPDNGFVFDITDSSALSHAISELASNPGRASMMGGRGREIVSRYSTECSAEGLERAVVHAVNEAVMREGKVH